MLFRYTAALFLVLASFTYLHADQMSATLLPLTEANPDACIDHTANVINGDYCATALDLEIPNPMRSFFNVITTQRTI